MLRRQPPRRGRRCAPPTKKSVNSEQVTFGAVIIHFALTYFERN